MVSPKVPAREASAVKTAFINMAKDEKGKQVLEHARKRALATGSDIQRALLLGDADMLSIDMILGDNLPIGVMAEIYCQTTQALRDGDALLVYSDGITEARDTAGEEFGMERLTQLMRIGRQAKLPPNAILQSLRQQVRAFVGSDVLIDDQTALMLELHPRRTVRRDGVLQRINPQLIILPWRLDALHALRSGITQLASHFSSDDVDRLTLASFEAATNILRHANPYFADATLTCRLQRRGQSLAVVLIYPGPVFVPPESPTPDFSGNASGDFGLYIIQQCVDLVAYLQIAPGISSIYLVIDTAKDNAQKLGLPTSINPWPLEKNHAT